MLESLLLKDGEYFLLEEHLTRLKNSAKYFGISFDLENAQKTLHDFARQNSRGDLKIRLLLDKNGEMTIESQPITQLETPLKVALADEPLDKDNPFLYHKTTNRVSLFSFSKEISSCF